MRKRRYSSRAFDNALKVFEAAVREHAFRGARHPDDHEEIEEQLELSRKKLQATHRKEFDKWAFSPTDSAAS